MAPKHLDPNPNRGVNEVPFLAFCSLSDLAGGGPGANEIETFAYLAADNSAVMLLEFLRAWRGPR